LIKTTGNHELREYEEMKAHDVAFEQVREWASDNERPLSEMAIKNLHEVLLVRPFWKEAQTPDGQSTRRLIKIGSYKEYSNSVRLQHGEMFHYTTPEETPIQMGELIQWYRAEEEKGELHPVALGALLQYKFVRIHPFDDGNGRISRLFMNYVLFKHNLPPVIIKSSDKKNYLFALNQADAGDIDAFVKYIAEQFVWSLELSLRAGNGLDVEEGEDWQKELTLLKKNERLKQQFTSELANTIKNDVYYIFIQKLVDKFAAFDDLFYKKTLFFKVTDHYEEINDAADIKKYGLAFGNYKSIEDSITFRLEYNNLKDSADGNGYWIDIKLRFNLYSYEIELGIKKIIIKKDYGYVPSTKVFDDAINLIGKDLLQYIKDNHP
jgi:Fic family protein